MTLVLVLAVVAVMLIAIAFDRTDFIGGLDE